MKGSKMNEYRILVDAAVKVCRTTGAAPQTMAAAAARKYTAVGDPVRFAADIQRGLDSVIIRYRTKEDSK